MYYKSRVNHRFKDIGNKYKTNCTFISEGSIVDMFKAEQTILEDFKDYKYIPKNKFTGYTECLSVNPVDFYYGYSNLEI